jgi:hypothetical protein
MKKDKISNLKLSLGEIKIKQNEFNREKNKKAKDSIDSQLTMLKNNLMLNFNLIEYDLHISMEIHNTDFFIHDVESILSKLEEKQTEE